MADFQTLVTVTCDSVAEAEQVLAERLEPDEDYGFPYTVRNGPLIEPFELTELQELILEAKAADSEAGDDPREAWQAVAEYASGLLGVQISA